MITADKSDECICIPRVYLVKRPNGHDGMPFGYTL